MAGLFLGIDVGTGGVRACAIDAQAGIRGFASAALPAPRVNGDAIDQAPELWWLATVAAIGKLGESVDLGDIARVVAETAGAGSTAINRHFETVRASAEEERRLTSEAMHEIY